mgnify:CR=1 FL=1
MKFHIALSVADVEASVQAYSKHLNCAPQVVVPRPGIPAIVEIPLVGGGDIEGAILKSAELGFEGLDLELVDPAGKVVAVARTDFDGFFLFDRVLGTVTLAGRLGTSPRICSDGRWVAFNSLAAWFGVHVVRVHDVEAVVAALRVVDAARGSSARADRLAD